MWWEEKGRPIGAVPLRRAAVGASVVAGVGPAEVAALAVHFVCHAVAELGPVGFTAPGVLVRPPEQLEYERVQDILTEAERFPGKPVYSDSMSKSQKKAWYQKNEIWKRERTTWLAEQLGISYSEAEKILKTRAERKQELYYPDEEKSSSSGGRSYYRGSSWSAYSRRSYGRSYGGRSYSSRSYGGGSGYYGRSGGSAGGETDLLPSIEDYVRYVKRLTGALWNTPKPRYIRS